MDKKFKTTKSSGFTLIELLVVVAILGIIAAIGITAYSGYVSSTKIKSAQNILKQIALGQSEYYSENGYYFTNSSSCGSNPTTSQEIEAQLFNGSKVIVDPNSKKSPKEATTGFYMCVVDHATNYKARAYPDPHNSSKCQIELLGDGSFKKTNC